MHLVPKQLVDVLVPEFMQRLPDYDSGFTAVATAKEKGERLRYVGSINAESGKCALELERYAKTHPFGRLSDSHNIVAFRTWRYNAQPLVV